MTRPSSAFAFTVGAHVLRCTLRTALAFADSGDVPDLAAVRFDPHDESSKISVTATDRLIASRQIVEVDGESFTFAVSRQTASVLIDAVPWLDQRRSDPAWYCGTTTFTQDAYGVVTALFRAPDVEDAVIPLTGRQIEAPDMAALFLNVADTDMPPEGFAVRPDLLARALAACEKRGSQQVRISRVRLETGPGSSHPILLRQGDDFAALVQTAHPGND